MIIIEASEKNQGRFSYPQIIQTTQDDYHIVYSWNRIKIQHIRFNRTWLEQEIAKLDIKSQPNLKHLHQESKSSNIAQNALKLKATSEIKVQQSQLKETL